MVKEEEKLGTIGVALFGSPSPPPPPPEAPPRARPNAVSTACRASLGRCTDPTTTASSPKTRSEPNPDGTATAAMAPSSASLSPSSSSGEENRTSAAVPTVALPPAAVVARPPPSSARRVPPPCWSVKETVALIDSYQEKWYSLRRGNLKASHWNEVAEAVHGRCPNLPGSTAKTAVQCRHKVEKLRKRYRSEKQRLLRINPNPRSPRPPPSSSSWPFFRKMETMEVGSSPGAPAGAASPAATTRAAQRRSSETSEDESSEDVWDGEEDDGCCRHETTNRVSNFRSVHGLLSNGTGLRLNIPKAVRSKSGVPRNEMLSSYLPGGGNGTTGGGGGYRAANHTTRFEGGFAGMKRLEGSVMEGMRRVEKKRHREQEEHAVAGGMGEIVAAVRMLGDGFMRMEQMKMDMTREIHNLRMEMELKHTEMILDTHRRVVDAFVTGIAGRKRAKVSTES